MKNQLIEFVNDVIKMRQAQNDYFKKGRQKEDLIRSKKLEILVDEKAATLKKQLEEADRPVCLSVSARMVGFLLQLKPKLDSANQAYVDHMIEYIKKGYHDQDRLS